MAGYSGTPLALNLGIKSGHRVCLVNAPDGFVGTLEGLPPDVTFVAETDDRLDWDCVVLFVVWRTEFEPAFLRLAKRLTPAGMLWVAWPKRAAKVPTDLTFEVVQPFGLQTGLVDNKSCAVDETWSGLRFVIRLKDRPKGAG